MIAAAVGLVGMAFMLAAAPEAPQKTAATVVAEVKGQTITMEELERSATGELMNLAVQRHRVLENALERMVTERVIALEAKARSLNEAQLLQQEVYAKVVPPSDADVEAYYRSRPELTRQGQEKVAPQIRQALLNERRQKVYRDFTTHLKAKYGARTLLEPFRVKVDDGAAPARGPAGAPVTIVEFSDFECPYCRTLSRTLSDVTKQYGDNVRLVFRQFPLQQIHANAMRAAETAVCAAFQGKFWEMHDRLFAGGPLTEAEQLKMAAAAGLQADQLKACWSSGKAAERVRADMKAGAAAGVSSTPTFFVNGRPMRGAVAQAEIARVIEEELKLPRRR